MAKDERHVEAVRRALASGFLASAGQGGLDDLAATAVSMSAGSGLWVGPPPAGQTVGVVVGGRLQSFTVSVDGCVVPIAMLGPGRLFSARSILMTSETLILAVVPSEVAWLRTDLVRFQLRTAPAVALSLAQEMGQLVEQTRSELELQSVVRVRERLAARLAEFGGDGSPELQLTHEQLALMVGSRREVVSRHLRVLADQGMVALGRGRIRICDADGLRQVASA